LDLITNQLTTWVDAHDQQTYHRHKAITALFPYAVWQERYRQHPMIFNTFFHAANALSLDTFLWHHIQPFMNTLLNDTSDASLKRVAMLASPCIPWDRGGFQGLVQAWMATASAIPKEKEVAPNIVDALLRIAFFGLLPPGNHGNVWSWLTLRPSLPPICGGRYLGSCLGVMQQVRGLKDIEILKSYFLVVWSEWDSLWSSDPRAMCQCILEEFSGVEANSHRAELVQRLDEVIGELDKGLAYLQRDRPYLREDQLQTRKGQYEGLRKMLKEDLEASEIPTCMSSRSIDLFDLLTPVEHAQDLTQYSYAHSLCRICSRPSATPGHRPPFLYVPSVGSNTCPFFHCRQISFHPSRYPQVFAMSSTSPTSRLLRGQTFISVARHC